MGATPASLTDLANFPGPSQRSGVSVRRIELKPGERPDAVAADAPRLLVLREAAPISTVARGGLSIRLVLEGEETFELEGRTWRVRAGELIALWPGPAMIRRGQGRTVVLETPAAPSSSADAPPALVVPAASHSLGRWLMSRVAVLFGDPVQGPATANAALARVGDIPALEAAFLAKLGKIGAGKLATRLELLRRTEAARCRLDAAPGPLTLEGLARGVGLSPYHLARTFKDVFGVSPIAYQRGVRLDRAAEALQAGAPLGGVALDAGYAEPASFSRAFSRRHGISPGEAAKNENARR